MAQLRGSCWRCIEKISQVCAVLFFMLQRPSATRMISCISIFLYYLALKCRASCCCIVSAWLLQVRMARAAPCAAGCEQLPRDAAA
jgi:hypothetical protein